MDLLAARGFRVFRRNVMGVVPMKGGVVRVNQRGMADLWGWHIGTGRHLECEVKRPGKTPTAYQAAWLEDAWQHGALAFSCDSVESCEAELYRWGY